MKEWLIDTSVWIAFLRAEENPQVERLKQLIEQGATVGISPLIYMEILQGARSTHHFETYRDYFGSQPFFDVADPVRSMADAAAIYFRCRKAGITIRSTVDCLIAQVAIDNGLILLHNDRDFSHIARIVPELNHTTG
ncbi:type II toxin-antitoxin system VapC family toxin [Endothiovibrio diazotrophicus]